jgi:undecaprenyl diphosphate synthase
VDNSNSLTVEFTNLPTHIAIIMDGNGRWANARGKPRLEGHRAGTENIRTVLKACVDFGVKVLTIYAFSTENWGRPPDEVQGLMRLLMQVIESESNELHQEGVRIKHLGRAEGLAPDVYAAICRSIELTKENQRITLNVAFNYGGRAEILDAVKRIINEKVQPDKLTEELFRSFLYSNDLPDPDLIIRTAGEMRLSNFLLWQAAYTEYYSTPTYWPDFGRDELHQALLAYSHRQRRFGRV